MCNFSNIGVCLLHINVRPASSNLHEEQNVPILSTFRSSYFGTPLERTVFALLENLTSRKPFLDVVVTGHSFGAAMSSIAALRYASSNSHVRVSCIAFGMPRVGGEGWRRAVHSVPNLRVCRVENGTDPYVSLPAGSEWVHVGHAIQIANGGGGGDGDVAFRARKFDRDRSSSTALLSLSNANNLLGKVVGSVVPTGSSSQGKADHEIRSYCQKLTTSGDCWFEDFSELKGKGIRANEEDRMLA